MEKLEGWYNSKEYKKQTGFSTARFARLEDRLSAVVDWIIEREKMGGGASPKRKSK